MSCLRIPHHHLIYSLLLLFAAFFSLSFGQQSASATSVSYSYSASESNYPTAYYEYNASNVGFPFSFVSIDAHSSSINSRISQCFASFNSSLQLDSGLLYIDYNAFVLIHTNSKFVLNTRCGSDSMTLTFYDYNPIVPQDCPECPPIPETQYGDVLDKIYKAILFVPAMAFVLYLFYILFAWYVGGRK